MAACSTKWLNRPDTEYEEEAESKKKKKKRKHDNDYEIVHEKDEREDYCFSCLNKVPAHLTIHTSQNVFLTIPNFEPVLPGQCFIKSRTHETRCITEAQEDVIEEVNNIKSSLCKMLAEEKKTPVFMETYFKKNFHDKHMSIECLPIKTKKVDELKMFFKVRRRGLFFGKTTTLLVVI